MKVYVVISTVRKYDGFEIVGARAFAEKSDADSFEQELVRDQTNFTDTYSCEAEVDAS